MKKTRTKDEKIILKTKRNFVILVTSIIAIFFIAIDVSYAIYLKATDSQNLEKLYTVAFDVYFKDDKPQDIPFGDNHFFTITIDKDNNLTFIRGEENYSDFVIENKETLLANNQGQIGYIFYEKKDAASFPQGATIDANVKYVLVGIDRTIVANSNINSFVIISLILLVSLIVIYIIVNFLSARILKPIKDNLDKQKEFIADASHELKTPVTIINANATILKNENKDNKWIDNILDETKNMNGLIGDMISLAKVEEQKPVLEKEDISSIITYITLSFEPVAFEQHINFVENIEENIELVCNEKDIQKIAKILLDNAIKYVSKNGNIEINLKKEKNQILLSVYNTGCTIEDKDREKVFDRFYRDDNSRNSEQTKGSGLGLAILKEICDKYHYSVSIDSKMNDFFKISVIIK
ncbi:MAG: HAMP domain-containing sensor histidine kinase [Bacilli bacterium]